MTDPIRNFDSAATVRPAPMRPLKRLLVVAFAVGCIGVGIDLTHGPRAHALPTSDVQVPALAALSVDHSVVSLLGEEAWLEPGASVAAYSSSTLDAAEAAPALEKKLEFDGDAPDPGASIAAYGS